jgi:hypothetical protein
MVSFIVAHGFGERDAGCANLGMKICRDRAEMGSICALRN